MSQKAPKKAPKKYLRRGKKKAIQPAAVTEEHHTEDYEPVKKRKKTNSRSVSRQEKPPKDENAHDASFSQKPATKGKDLSSLL